MGNLLSHVRFYDFSELTGVRYETLFDSIDGWVKNTAEGGSISLFEQEVLIQGGTDPAAHAWLRKQPLWLNYVPSWNKKRLFRTFINFLFKLDGSDENFVASGIDPSTGVGFGFQIKGDGLYAYVSGDVYHEEVKVSEDLEPPWDMVWGLEAILFPRSHVQFKVNDIFKTNIPVGTLFDEDTQGVLLSYQVAHGGAFPHSMYFGNSVFFQDK